MSETGSTEHAAAYAAFYRTMAESHQEAKLAYQALAQAIAPQTKTKARRPTRIKARGFSYDRMADMLALVAQGTVHIDNYRLASRALGYSRTPMDLLHDGWIGEDEEHNHVLTDRGAARLQKLQAGGYGDTDTVEHADAYLRAKAEDPDWVSR